MTPEGDDHLTPEQQLREPRETSGPGAPRGAHPPHVVVGDSAESVVTGDVPAKAPSPDSFSHWIANRLLTPEELAQFEEEDGT